MFCRYRGGMPDAFTSLLRFSPAAVLIAVAVLAGSAPAAADPAPVNLPATDVVHVVECDTAGGALQPLQVLSVALPAATLTPLGGGSPTSAGCSYDATIDPTSGIAYFIASDDTLWSFDTASTTSALIGTFRLATDEAATRQLVAIAIDPRGDAYGIESSGQLHALDLSTAKIRPIGAPPVPRPVINTLAAHPVTGELYAVTYGGDLGLYRYDTGSGAFTLVTTITQRDIYTMGFDSAGTLWVLEYTGNPTLAAVTITDWAGTYTAQGTLRLASDPTRNFYTESMFLTSSAWPDFVEPKSPRGGGGNENADPELAATGAESPAAAMILGLGLVGLLVGGALLTAARFRRPLR